MPTKTCKKCRENKEVTQFYAAGGGFYRGECSECTRKNNRRATLYKEPLLWAVGLSSIWLRRPIT